MAAIIHQKDKRSGITYVYESKSYWDKEKQQSRAKRKLIGKLDPDTGAVVPTDGRGRKRTQDLAQDQKLNTTVKRRFYGATYLLDAIGNKLGIAQDLKACFPEAHKQIQSLAYYLTLETDSPLFRFGKWHALHKHPCDGPIPSQLSSELFASIAEAQREQFFRRQGRRRMEKEYWAYDITSISSYSELLKQVQYGMNKEHDRLPQINLAMVFGEQSNLPFYYRRLAGNIPDSKSVRQLLADLNLFNLPKLKLVTDRGFYSKDNINGLYKDHVKFLIATNTSLKLIRENLNPIYDDFRSFEHYNEKYELYTRTVRTMWDYSERRPYKGDTFTAKKRLYIHYYYNIDRAADDEKAFDRRLIALQRELESGKRIPEHETLYQKYFDVKETPERGIKATVVAEAVREAKRYYGFFTLITNETMDVTTALEIYRNKDVVEKAFGNLKERLSMRRTLVSSQRSLDGKLFIQFIALIYLSYIKKRMQDRGLFKAYTIQTLLDRLDVIECYEHPGHKPRVGEILEKQKRIYRDLGIDPPASL